MHPTDNDDLESDGTYRVAGEANRDAQEVRRTPEEKAVKSVALKSATPQRGAGTAETSTHDDDDDDDDDNDGESASLPPPIARPANPKPWVVVAGAISAFLMIAWLAGAPQLVVPEPSSDGTPIIPELGFFERLAGVARTAVYLALATLGGVFGVLCLAFVRQRPVGDVVALFAKVLAIVAIGMLVWLVPSDIRFVKQALNVLGVPLVAGLCAMPVLRLPPRDAALATAFTMMGMLLLVLIAHAVVWAAGGAG